MFWILRFTLKVAKNCKVSAGKYLSFNTAFFCFSDLLYYITEKQKNATFNDFPADTLPFFLQPYKSKSQNSEYLQKIKVFSYLFK